MPCYSPIQAWQGPANASGKRPLVFQRPKDFVMSISCPCGRCIGCRLEYARQWAMRCRDESKMHSQNCFITLTYSDEFLPRDSFVSKDTWQLFMKRLRKVTGEGIRFFMCAEYGPKTFRPHYHALLFGYDFPDRKFLKVTGSGEKIFTSEILSKVWGFGYASVGDLTFGSAAYVARYAVKKVGSVTSDDHFLVPTTGELRPPEFRLMSRGSKKLGTGGIGRSFYEKYKSDMFPHDFRVVDGVKSIPPRYYGSIYELTDPVSFANIKLLRKKRGRKFVDGHDDNDLIRLGVKEVCKLADIKALKREGDFS